MGGISSVIVGNTKRDVKVNARKFFNEVFRKEEMYPRVDTEDFPKDYDFEANGFTKVYLDPKLVTAVIKIFLTEEKDILGYVRLTNEHKQSKFCAWVSVHS